MGASGARADESPDNGSLAADCEPGRLELPQSRLAAGDVEPPHRRLAGADSGTQGPRARVAGRVAGNKESGLASEPPTRAARRIQPRNEGLHRGTRQKAKTADERDQIAREKYPEPRSYSHRFLELADSARDDPAAADALVWIIERCFDGPDFTRAIDLLAAHHAANRMVGHGAMTLTHSSLTGTGEALPRHHRPEHQPRHQRADLPVARALLQEPVREGPKHQGRSRGGPGVEGDDARAGRPGKTLTALSAGTPMP